MDGIETNQEDYDGIPRRARLRFGDTPPSNPQLKSQFRISKNEHRFAPPIHSWNVLFESCLRCRSGDLLWEDWLREWYCIQCGWHEFESPNADPITRRGIR